MTYKSMHLKHVSVDIIVDIRYSIGSRQLYDKEICRMTALQVLNTKLCLNIYCGTYDKV